MLSEHHPLSTWVALGRECKGDWSGAMERRMPKRKPDTATRISAIEKQLQRQYTLAADIHFDSADSGYAATVR